MTIEELAVWFQDEAQFCGCGAPEVAAETLAKLLELSRPYSLAAQQSLVTDEGARYLLLYWLDAMGLTEHGGSVDGAWLTEKGTELLAALTVERERDEFETLFEQRCIHGVLVTEATHDCMAQESP